MHNCTTFVGRLMHAGTVSLASIGCMAGFAREYGDDYSAQLPVEIARF